VLRVIPLLVLSQRIEELQALLQDENFSMDFDNIKAAITYLEGFDGDLLCKPAIVNFQDGQLLESLDQATGDPLWTEVSIAETYFLHC
jgi:hypothetical protein